MLVNKVVFADVKWASVLSLAQPLQSLREQFSFFFNIHLLSRDVSKIAEKSIFMCICTCITPLLAILV